jgi:uncharacterized protein (TIGR00159 family)
LFSFFRPQDIADIIIMSVLVYQLYRWFRNTKALQVVIGLGFLGIVYVVTKNLGLLMTSWVLQELGTVLLVLLIVIFQSEIRQALYRFSLLRHFFGRPENSSSLELMELATTVFAFAAERTGAIIVFQRQEPLEEYILHGVHLDAKLTPQLLGSIFHNGTPLHDGAVIIRDDRLVQASCHLPLSANTDLPLHFGTRHRAAIGLSERSDAAVVVVSEERGDVSLALAGELQRIDSPGDLAARLGDLLAPPEQEERVVSLQRRIFSNLWPKVAIVMLVMVSWLMITARQGGLLTVTAPIKFHNLPQGVTLTKATPEEVEVELKTISSLIPSPKKLDIVVDLNLAGVREGSNQLAVKKDDIQLPAGVTVVGIKPSMVKVSTEKKIRKEVRVKVKTVGRLPASLRLKRMLCDPPTVMIEGPERSLARVETIETEGIDLSSIRGSTVVEKRLLPPAPLAKSLREEPVKIRLIISR